MGRWELWKTVSVVFQAAMGAFFSVHRRGSLHGRWLSRLTRVTDDIGARRPAQNTDQEKPMSDDARLTALEDKVQQLEAMVALALRLLSLENPVSALLQS